MSEQNSIAVKVGDKELKVPLYKTIMVSPGMLKEDPDNPRQIDTFKFEALKRSMIKQPNFIKVRPIIANVFPGREMIVIGGNQRLKAAIELKLHQVPVIFTYLEPNLEREWNIKDNIPAGDWDRTKLAAELTKLHESEYDLSGIGFSGDELEDFMQMDKALDNPADDPDYNGTTPAKEVECPMCGHNFVPKKKGRDQAAE